MRDSIALREIYTRNEIRLIEWEREREKQGGREKAEKHLILCYYYARVLYGCFVLPTYSKYSISVSLFLSDLDFVYSFAYKIPVNEF